ncbi:MAG: DsbA family oxidoreductase [Pseudomonadota bacterium]
MSAPLRVDIVSDTVCPWCYVGKRHLEAAMQQRPDVAFDCHWQPFQLNPNMPVEGVDRETHWKKKFGDSERIRDMVDRLKKVGEMLDIPFAFGEIKRQPNTLRGHALLHALDGQWDRQNALKEALLKAFFVDARDIGDEQTLLELSATIDMDETTAKSHLEDTALIDRVRALDQQARQIGISGVPTFIFDQKTGMSGAQPVEALLEMIDQLRPEQSPQPVLSS